MTPFEKFSTTRSELASAMIERDQEIDLVLVAMIAQEHVLLVGQSGTGKSMLSDAIVSWMHGDKFAVLVNKFTTPEEVFGPISVSGLKADKYRRVLTGKLPEAHVAFIDEIFKASSAILNTLLQVLNERTFRNDDVILNCPLMLCIAASNEWPGDQEGGKELVALFDRFLFRKLVKPVATERSVHRLLWDKSLLPRFSTTITVNEIDQATDEAYALPWTAEAQEALMAIRREAKQEGIHPGDRRMRKAVFASQAFAWLNGGSEVTPEHLEILAHVLWDDPAEQPRKIAEIVGKIANPAAMKVNSLLMECEGIVGALDTRDLQKTALAAKKLGDIHKQLKTCAGTKAAQATAHLEAEIKRIRLATVNALGA